MEDSPNQEIEVEQIKARSIKGISSLITRDVLGRVIGLVGFTALTIKLGVAEIGIFTAINEIIAIIGYFSDVGLAAAVIQKKEKPTKEDLQTVFTIQQVLVLLLITLVVFLSPLINQFYRLNHPANYLLYALLASFFLSSLKTIPSILMERTLKFDKLALVSVVENLVYWVTVVFFAYRNFGIYSYIFAVLARGLVGTTVLYLISPWEIGLSFSIKSLKELLKFGVPYQANTFLSVIKDRLSTLILFRIVGDVGIGFINWAQFWPSQPLRFIMDNVTKVTFPAISRLQDDTQRRKVTLEKSLFYSLLIIFPFLTGLAVVAPIMIQVIPNWNKWQPALALLYLFLFSTAWAAVSTPMTNVLYAIGKVKVTFYLMIMWTALTLTLYPLFAIRLGFFGVAVASAIVNMFSIIPILITRKFIKFDFKYIFQPLIASLLMGISVKLISSVVMGWAGLILSIVLGVAIYTCVILLLTGTKLILEIKELALLAAKR